MTEQQIQTLVNEIIGQTIGVAADTIGDVDSLIALGADSFHFVELVAHLEAEFSVTLPYELSEIGGQTARDYVLEVKRAMGYHRGSN